MGSVNHTVDYCTYSMSDFTFIWPLSDSLKWLLYMYVTNSHWQGIEQCLLSRSSAMLQMNQKYTSQPEHEYDTWSHKETGHKFLFITLAALFEPLKVLYLSCISFSPTASACYCGWSRWCSACACCSICSVVCKALSQKKKPPLNPSLETKKSPLGSCAGLELHPQKPSSGPALQRGNKGLPSDTPLFPWWPPYIKPRGGRRIGRRVGMVGALGIKKKEKKKTGWLSPLLWGSILTQTQKPLPASGGMPFSFSRLCYLHHRIIEVVIFFFFFPKLRSAPREVDNHRLHDPRGLPWGD